MKVIRCNVELEIPGTTEHALSLASSWVEDNVRLEGEPDRFSMTVMNTSPIHADKRTNRVLIIWSADSKPVYDEDDSAF